MAIKDRPRIFQLITLSLFSFSITVILVSSVTRCSRAEQEKQVVRHSRDAGYAGFAATPAKHLIDLKR